ncbi:MAG: hypothetical protein A2854_04210 [Parcubacteria group bacterium RIFCSPHIGHO2_01_FULL_56_18]|nr:MAG: hypothetical protein A2854_04210 [Parcubacteria group bacterium RIFCSPHIGHO2_01_FULL_56_18]
MPKYAFFLGGKDAEMVRIADVLGGGGEKFADADLGWGAKASAYGIKIAEAAETGFIPVLVELEVDIDLPQGTVVVDHHGERSAEPASILQVLALLDRKPSRWDELVAANDSGWFHGLQAIGATREEMALVRQADRVAQGITPAHEREAERALTASREMAGAVRVIRMAHSKCATVGDRLAINGVEAGRTMTIPAYLVLSEDGEANFSGDGATAAALHVAFPGGWVGGAGLGQADGSAYWGGYPADLEAVVAFLRERTGYGVGAARARTDIARSVRGPFNNPFEVGTLEAKGYDEMIAGYLTHQHTGL